MRLCRLVHTIHRIQRTIAPTNNRWAVVVGLLTLTPLTWGQEFQKLSEVRQAVAEHLEAYYRGEGIEQTRVSVGRLDGRLRLAHCEEPLALTVNDEERAGGNITVHTRCPGPTTWALYVPAKVAVYRRVAIANRGLRRGRTLAESDMTLELRNTGELRQGFVTQPDAALGQELRRPLREGEPVRMNILTEPKVIERGDQVSLRARTGPITVNTTGTALSSGRVGDQIRVRNDRSERVVRGRVLSTDTVEVIL